MILKLKCLILYLVLRVILALQYCYESCSYHLSTSDGAEVFSLSECHGHDVGRSQVGQGLPIWMDLPPRLSEVDSQSSGRYCKLVVFKSLFLQVMSSQFLYLRLL